MTRPPLRSGVASHPSPLLSGETLLSRGAPLPLLQASGREGEVSGGSACPHPAQTLSDAHAGHVSSLRVERGNSREKNPFSFSEIMQQPSYWQKWCPRSWVLWFECVGGGETQSPTAPVGWLAQDPTLPLADGAMRSGDAGRGVVCQLQWVCCMCGLCLPSSCLMLPPWTCASGSDEVLCPAD